MEIALDLELVTEETRAESREFEVGQKVYYKAHFNNPGNYAPDEMLSGIVIEKFRGGDNYIYRIELDRTWQRTHKSQLGQKIIIGNIYSGRILPLT